MRRGTSFPPLRVVVWLIQVVDEAFDLVGKVVLSALSEPAKLFKVFMGLLGVALAGLVVANATSLAGECRCV